MKRCKHKKVWHFHYGDQVGKRWEKCKHKKPWKFHLKSQTLGYCPKCGGIFTEWGYIPTDLTGPELITTSTENEGYLYVPMSMSK